MQNYSLDVTWHSSDQREIFTSPGRYHVLHAGRRWGKTKGAFNRKAELMVDFPNSKHLWVDTTQRNIDLYFDEHMAPILPQGFYKWDKQKKVLKFINGSVCHYGSVQHPENLEGFGYHFIWLNEAGIILKGAGGERLWNNTLRPMAMEGEGATVWFIGTPKGLGLFKDFSERGNSEDPKYADWVTHHRTSYDRPGIRDSELDELVRDLPPSAARQEIMAEFLETDDGAPVISWALAKDAWERPIPPDEKYWHVWGCDPSQHGDDRAALAKRHWNRLTEPTKTRGHLDSIQGAAWLQSEYENTDDDMKPRWIIIDSIGYGAGWYDNARRLGLPVMPCNVSNNANDPEKFFRKRDELWFKAAKWLETGSIAGDMDLRLELCKPLQDIKFLGKHGKIKVEAKEDMKKRLKKDGESPNRADAFIMTLDCGVEVRDQRPMRRMYQSWQEEGTWQSI